MPTEATPNEPFHRLKDACFTVLSHPVLVVLALALLGGIFAAWLQGFYTPASQAYHTTLALGILASATILYKEHVNRNFLRRFCHIGQTIDCNRVLDSSGASIAEVSLGELSLLYFTVLWAFALLRPIDFCGIAALCNSGALCFTLYSLYYQVFVVRKGCLLCMAVNITVWCNAVSLFFIIREAKIVFSLTAFTSFLLLGGIGAFSGIFLKSKWKDREKKSEAERRLSSLLNPDCLRQLLTLEKSLFRIPDAGILLHNDLPDNNIAPILIVTNPNCGNCKRMHPQVDELSRHTGISLLLQTTPGNSEGKQVAEAVIAAYQKEGWEKAVRLLDEWFVTQRLTPSAFTNITPQAEQIWTMQQNYCREQKIDKTPFILIGNRPLPEAYSLADIRYALN